jgi:diketogulonate reductase-like aldo/keto reductase
MTVQHWTDIPSVRLPAGEDVPALGQGTWNMAERSIARADEIASLRAGLDLGLTLVDTAEMYADGAAQELVGEAIAGRRDEVFLVDKVMPHHADRPGVLAACRTALDRLRTDRIDLYLLHWTGRVPLEETVAAFGELQQRGQIRYWGVSNFDSVWMNRLDAVDTGRQVQTDQVLYNLTRRGPEFDLFPYCADRGLPVMAYSPIEQGRLLGHPQLEAVALRHDATPAQVALAWVLRRPGTIVIPKTGSPQRVVENAGALDLQLTPDDLADLDTAFPPPRRAEPLEML